MFRALIMAALAWFALSNAAHACLGTNLHRGVVFETIPWTAPENTIVLRVEFDRADVRRLAGPHPTSPIREWLLMEKVAVNARVIEVVRGEYNQPTVRVAIGGSSCDSPFIFGRRGYIVGTLVTPAEGQARFDAAVADQPGHLTFSWPFTETVFDAITETRDGRDLRQAGLSYISGLVVAIGNYDGAPGSDHAYHFESREGALVIGIRRRNREIAQLWSGDISSLTSYAVRTAAPGRYRTACHLYGDDCGGAPREVSLTHDGLIVEGLVDHSLLLYYWEDGAFKNVHISE